MRTRQILIGMAIAVAVADAILLTVLADLIAERNVQTLARHVSQQSAIEWPAKPAWI